MEEEKIKNLEEKGILQSHCKTMNFSFLSARKNLYRKNANSSFGDRSYPEILVGCGHEGDLKWGGSFFMSREVLRNVSAVDSSFKKYLESESDTGASCKISKIVEEG